MAIIMVPFRFSSSSSDQDHLVKALQDEIFEECGEEEGGVHLGLRLPLLRATILEVFVHRNIHHKYSN